MLSNCEPRQRPANSPLCHAPIGNSGRKTADALTDQHKLTVTLLQQHRPAGQAVATMNRRDGNLGGLARPRVAFCTIVSWLYDSPNGAFSDNFRRFPWDHQRTVQVASIHTQLGIFEEERSARREAPWEADFFDSSFRPGSFAAALRSSRSVRHFGASSGLLG
jgi:hypothetical protein